MKLNKMIFPLMLALVAVLATTGCKHGTTRVTPLPGERTALVGPSDNLPNTLSNGNPIDTAGTGPLVGSGPIATSDNWDPANCDQDRAALAEYTVHFAFDSAAILSKEESKLVIVSEKLKSDPSVKLLIEGHCDERGTEEYNRALGERRALALREALASAGIDPNRIRTISYGKDKPADPDHNEAAWSKNRRGEFILCHLKTAL